MFDQQQSVGIYRVDMKQIILHLSDNLAKFRQIASEDTVACQPFPSSGKGEGGTH